MAPQNITFTDFKKGLLNSENAFDFPEGGLKEGQNLDLADGGLKTRPGSSISSTGSFPAGEIQAMCQFRSPTTEQSYLVAQVKYPLTFQEGTTGPTARLGHSAVWDIGNGRMLVFGGGELGNYNDLWAYDPSTDTWTELAPTGGPPHIRRDHCAIYDPVTETMVVFAGRYNDGSWTYLNDVWTLDCQTDTWTEQSPTGDVPSVPVLSNMYVGVYRAATGGLVVFQGANNSLEIYELDLSTWVWTSFTSTIPTPQPAPGEMWPHYGDTAAAYDTANDTIIIAGGQDTTETNTKATYSLSFDTSAWTRKADIPLTDWAAGLKAVYCSGNVIITGDIGGYGAGSDLYLLLYSVSGNTWSVGAWEGTTNPPNRASHSMSLSDSGYIIIFAGSNNLGTLDDVWFTPEICATGTVFGYGLYASDDALPTSGV